MPDMFADENAMLDQRIRSQLDQFGIPANLQGYEFLLMAVKITYAYNCMFRISMYIDIYHVIAEQFGLTPSSVERSMRTSLMAAWENNRDYITRVFHRKPRVGAFILCLASRLRFA